MATDIHKLGTHNNFIPRAQRTRSLRVPRASRTSQPIHTRLRNLYILRNSTPTNPNSTNQKPILDQRQPTSKDNNAPISLFNPIQPSTRIRLIQQRSTGYPIEEYRSASFFYGNVYAAGVCVVHAEEGYEETGGVDDGDVLRDYGGCGFFCCGDYGGGLGGGDVVALWKVSNEDIRRRWGREGRKYLNRRAANAIGSCKVSRHGAIDPVSVRRNRQ